MHYHENSIKMIDDGISAGLHGFSAIRCMGFSLTTVSNDSKVLLRQKAQLCIYNKQIFSIKFFFHKECFNLRCVRLMKFSEKDQSLILHPKIIPGSYEKEINRELTIVVSRCQDPEVGRAPSTPRGMPHVVAGTRGRSVHARGTWTFRPHSAWFLVRL